MSNSIQQTGAENTYIIGDVDYGSNLVKVTFLTGMENVPDDVRYKLLDKFKELVATEVDFYNAVSDGYYDWYVEEGNDETIDD